MTDPIIDNHGRRMNYLRLSVTDRCNFRCHYCMPAEGIQLVDRTEILSWEELYRLSRIFVNQGIEKIRITGGEPFVRKGLPDFLRRISILEDDLSIGITTNGSLISEHLPRLKSADITLLNFSLDSLRSSGFQTITRRESLEKTLYGLFKSLEMGFHVKVNMVVMDGLNDQEIPDFVELTRHHPLTVRFIEAMPFNGNGDSRRSITGDQILERIRNTYPDLVTADTSSGVAINFQVPGYEGNIGIIHGFSRTFCHTCSRIRVSAEGELRTCLYARPSLDLRSMLRSDATDDEITAAIRTALNNRYRDGFAAEAAAREEKKSMVRIGG